MTVRNSEFFHNEQVVVNWCDGFTFVDNWVGGCYEPTCGRGKALFENHDTLFITRMLGVPSPRPGYDQRWIDNVDGMVIARDSRFGGSLSLSLSLSRARTHTHTHTVSLTLCLFHCQVARVEVLQ
jgi:hypothetical protein